MVIRACLRCFADVWANRSPVAFPASGAGPGSFTREALSGTCPPNTCARCVLRCIAMCLSASEWYNSSTTWTGRKARSSVPPSRTLSRVVRSRCAGVQPLSHRRQAMPRHRWRAWPAQSGERISPMELNQRLQGWKPSVLLVRVAQELARFWQLRLVGLDPAAHRLHHWSYRWQARYREAGQKIFDSYEALWDHFDCKPGPLGWVVVPLNSDEKLAATALSPEKRARQTRRADYWIRTRKCRRGCWRPVRVPPGCSAGWLSDFGCRITRRNRCVPSSRNPKPGCWPPVPFCWRWPSSAR